jgi:hypothetical protein
LRHCASMVRGHCIEGLMDDQIILLAHRRSQGLI